MPDDKTKRGSPDNKRLNKSEPYEMAYARKKAAKASAAKKSGAAKTTARKTTAKKSPATKTAARKTATRKTAVTKNSPATKAPARSAPSRQAPSRTAVAAKAGSRKAPARKNAAPSRPTPHPPEDKQTVVNTAPKTMTTPDAVDLLVDDHLQVDRLFKRYETLAKRDGSAADRKALAAQVCGLLKTHTRLEEQIFYPAARKAGVDADLIDEADIEHASAKELIAQIESGGPDDDKYDAKVKVLGEYIAHHVKEEHTEMFTKCRRSKMNLVAMRADLEALRGGSDAASSPQEGESPGLVARIETFFNRS